MHTPTHMRSHTPAHTYTHPGSPSHDPDLASATDHSGMAFAWECTKTVAGMPASCTSSLARANVKLDNHTLTVKPGVLTQGNATRTSRTILTARFLMTVSLMVFLVLTGDYTMTLTARRVGDTADDKVCVCVFVFVFVCVCVCVLMCVCLPLCLSLFMRVFSVRLCCVYVYVYVTGVDRQRASGGTGTRVLPRATRRGRVHVTHRATTHMNAHRDTTHTRTLSRSLSLSLSHTHTYAHTTLTLLRCRPRRMWSRAPPSPSPPTVRSHVTYISLQSILDSILDVMYTPSDVHFEHRCG